MYPDNGAGCPVTTATILHAIDPHAAFTTAAIQSAAKGCWERGELGRSETLKGLDPALKHRFNAFFQWKRGPVAPQHVPMHGVPQLLGNQRQERAAAVHRFARLGGCTLRRV